ncbi:Peptidoglycan-binding protein ArfA [Mycobacterium innocens]|uniref:Peptidoglycan-binding protein ArfA n=1 Tax=Mycobacterium innocens TaxID=2341083 RepID=A0A498QDR2_9MYCO|nr:Peptidoglycan-binding protein ArfA [Mycobacterium innocens]
MVGSQPVSDMPPAPTRAWRLRRHPLGVAWLIALAVIPLLIAAIGYGAFERPTSVTGPAGELPTLTTTSSTSNASDVSWSLLSISRSGNTITLIGDFPDDNSKAALLAALRNVLTPGVTVIDQIRIDPLVRALDFANAEPVFTAGAAIPDFSLKVERNTVTLSGTATSPDQKDAVERAAKTAWPGVTVANNIEVKAPSPTPGASPPSGSGASGPCADLPAAINALTGGAIAFKNDGVSLTPADNQILSQVAAKLKACPDARVTVNGYSDNGGGEGINFPLSVQRATTVADFLAAQGVARDHITAQGYGSANPIAGNDTPEGRAKNRRVEIVVS